MTAPREGSFLSLSSTGFHRIVYNDYGPADGPPVVCVHYLSGNAFYFDALARDLARLGYRVIAPDMPGRGRSDWLKNPEDYNFQKYAADLTALLAHIGVTEPRSVDWIGASMGGLIGIVLASLPDTPIRRMALIDIGPEVPEDQLKPLADAFATVHAQTFPDLGALKAYIKKGRGPAWGPGLDEEYWNAMAEHGCRALEDGQLALACDPAINVVFSRLQDTGCALWPYWDAMTCPVLAVRGENSPLFPPWLADKMATRKDTVIQTVAGAAHVPSMATPDQMALVTEWLEGPSSAA